MNEQDQNDPAIRILPIKGHRFFSTIQNQDTSQKMRLMLDSWMTSLFQENQDDTLPSRGMKEQDEPENQAVSIHHEVLDPSMKLVQGFKEQIMLPRLLPSQDEDVEPRNITLIDHSGDKEEYLSSVVQSSDDFFLMRKMVNVSLPESDSLESFIATSQTLLRKDAAAPVTDATQYILMTSGRNDFLKNKDFHWNGAKGSFTNETEAPKKQKDERKEKYEKKKSFL
eukprot:TRINITY_DN1004_c0_g1_i14.p1 TRINITY_DN1004_c0_g1~~TRINITY_DN1004_c0_g1_i14.p1  ORF type:complete len:225 (-),score=50.15 TRINITY_DN1004_c0_g1_i14:69-743(-)